MGTYHKKRLHIQRMAFKNIHGGSASKKLGGKFQKPTLKKKLVPMHDHGVK
jgi:hypothetical protein